MKSPPQQVGKGQPGTTELLVEPDAEVVKRCPRRQTRAETLKLMRSLSPEAKGVEQLVVGTLYDLADRGNPLPQALGPPPLAGVTFGRADKLRSVALEPLLMIFGSLKALIHHIVSRSSRAHAVMSLRFG